MTNFINMGLQEVLVEFGGEYKRKNRLHTLHSTRFRAAFCSVLVKVHVLSGNDAVSKVGTKHAALTCNPLSLTNFAETDSITKVDISVAERYLVRFGLELVQTPDTADTFDKFRHNSYLNEKVLTDLPPTSSAICGHVRWCFCVIRNAITLLETYQHDLLPQNFGWTIEVGVMIPTASIQPILPELLVCCLCGGRCEIRKCTCKANGHIYGFSSVTKKRDLSVHVSTNDENMLVN